MTLTCTNVTLRQKALRNDRISLYLDYYPAIRNPFYVVFQIIGSYFCLSDIKNQTISFFVSFFKAYDTSAEDFFDL